MRHLIYEAAITKDGTADERLYEVTSKGKKKIPVTSLSEEEKESFKSLFLIASDTSLNWKEI